MKLYHGSNMEIDCIDLRKCKPFKDFGKGFYLTEIALQAEQMARRTALIFGGEPKVAAFEFDMQGATEDTTLNIKRSSSHLMAYLSVLLFCSITNTYNLNPFNNFV